MPFHADRQLDYDCQKLYKGGYLFLQSIYYGLRLDQVCRKIRERHRFQYDLNAILSDLIYTRILEPGSKRASYRAAMDYLEKPSYEEHDVYRALDVLASECDFIQSEAYSTSSPNGIDMGTICASPTMMWGVSSPISPISSGMKKGSAP